MPPTLASPPAVPPSSAACTGEGSDQVDGTYSFDCPSMHNLSVRRPPCWCNPHPFPHRAWSCCLERGGVGAVDGARERGEKGGVAGTDYTGVDLDSMILEIDGVAEAAGPINARSAHNRYTASLVEEQKDRKKGRLGAGG